MKIEVGKTYRCRNGCLARVYATDGSGYYAVHGAVKSGGGWDIKEWDAKGTRCSSEDGYDLVSDWKVEPRMLAYICVSTISVSGRDILPGEVRIWPEDVRANKDCWRRASWLDQPLTHHLRSAHDSR